MEMEWETLITKSFNTNENINNNKKIDDDDDE